MAELPAGHDALGAALLIAGFALALGAVIVAFRRGWLARTFAGAASATLLVLAIGTAPFTARRLYESFRIVRAYPSAYAQNYPAYHNDLHATLYDALVRMIPRNGTFYVAATAAASFQDRAAFETYPLARLLPRRAVTSPEAAEWLVTWGVRPRLLGVPVARTWLLDRDLDGHPVWLARRGRV